MASQLLIFRSCFPDFCVLLPVLEINITQEKRIAKPAQLFSVNFIPWLLYWWLFKIILFNWAFFGFLLGLFCFCQEGRSVEALGQAQGWFH